MYILATGERQPKAYARRWIDLTNQLAYHHVFYLYRDQKPGQGLARGLLKGAISAYGKLGVSRVSLSPGFPRAALCGRSVGFAEGLCTSFRCDQHVVGGGFEGEADGEERSEGGVAGAAAVEAEDELVEVGLEVGAAQAVERRRFEVENKRWVYGRTRWAAIGPMTWGS